MSRLRFWAKATASLLSNATRREFLHELLTAGLRADAALRAPTVWIGVAYPEIYGLPVDLGTVTYRAGNVTPFELYCLVAIAQLRQPATIFEFGTYDGSTTRALARAVPGAQVYTIDLPTADSPAEMIAPVPVEVERRRELAVGSAFSGEAEASRITQLWGDSRSFDYTGLEGTIDLVFVDASHEEAFVRSDTENALELRSPRGIVVWHDYAEAWPGVRSVIDELVEQGEPVVRLDATSLALLSS